VPTAPQSGGPQITWKVKVERLSDGDITYWIYITNRSSNAVDVEVRYAVLDGDKES
jgi:hypothetical protein